MAALFVFNPRGLSPTDCAADVALLFARLERPVPAQVVYATDHFLREFSRHGNWDAWAKAIVRERDRFGRPQHTEFLVITEFSAGRFGKATAVALVDALRLRLPTHWVQHGGDHGLLNAHEVVETDPHALDSGWFLR